MCNNRLYNPPVTDLSSERIFNPLSSLKFFLAKQTFFENIAIFANAFECPVSGHVFQYMVNSLSCFYVSKCNNFA